MITPELITIAGLIISSMVFYVYAMGVNRERLTLDGFMLFDRGLNKSQFGNTLAASSYSLALSVTFYFYSHPLYGLFMLFSPISYISGQYFFVWLVNKSGVDFGECRTISDLCYKLYPSKAIARLITAMTLSTLIMLLFVELYIGTIILTVFLPDDIVYKTLAFLIMGTLVLMYVRLGGYKALIKTDKWQLALMLTSVMVIFIHSMMAPGKYDAPMSETLSNMLHYKEDNWPLLGFVLWLCLLNFLMPFTQISYWQRMAASKNTSVSMRGLIHAYWKLLLLFLCPMLGFILLHAKGYSYDSLPDFIESMKYTDVFSEYILFPLLMVGFCSMIFSSADTTVIAMVYILADKNTFLDYLSKLAEKKLRKTLMSFMASILAMLVLIYWLQYTGLEAWLMPLIHTICGQLSILVPLPLFILMRLAKVKQVSLITANRKNTFMLFNSILISWAILMVNTYLSKTTGSQLWIQISVPIGIVIVGLTTWVIGSISNRYEVNKLVRMNM